jgi:nickel-dependent lactate racemase
VAYGLHKPASRELEVEFLGEDAVKEMEIVSHNAEDEGNLTYIGKTSFGTRLSVNNLILKSSPISSLVIAVEENRFFREWQVKRLFTIITALR